MRARDSGMDVVYEGIRMTPAQIAASALQEGVHVIGLSILSGSHRELIPAVIDALREAGVTAPVVVGGIIPEQDVALLQRAGVAAVYTPKDFDITRIMRDIVELVRRRRTRRPRANGHGPLRQRLGVSADGAALGARLRERDLSAAPAALNLLESSAGRRPRAVGEAPRRALPRRARRRGARARDRRHRAAGRRQVDAALGAAEGLARAGAHAWRCSPSIPARAARAARCSAIARASSSTPPTAGC